MKQKKRILCIAALIGFLLGCKPKLNTIPYFNTSDFTPQFLSSRQAEKQITHHIPAFNCTDQNGQPITETILDKKISVVDFFYTRCVGICPKLTNAMHTIVSNTIGDTNLVFLSFSVTPIQDSVAALQQYARVKKITDARWHLLTGNQAAIYNLARNEFFADERRGLAVDTTQFLHTEDFILIDRSRRIRGVFNGTLPLDAKRIVDQIKQLEAESL